MNAVFYIRLLRPAQWLKNLMLFFPPFLGGALLNPGIIGSGTIPFLSFCFASSSIYILNDVLDAANDARHPTKKDRPIPAGKVSKGSAAILAVLLLLSAISLGIRLDRSFLLFLLLYVLVSGLYSLKLKDLPLIDLFCISAGFVVRLQAGGVTFHIDISDWLFLSVFLLSLFLSTGKRLSEKLHLKEEAADHRKALAGYPDGFLDGVLYLTASAVLITYSMYALAKPFLVYTVPLCTFGLLRYIFKVKSGNGGDPTESLLRDLPLFVVSLLWAVVIGWGLYVKG